MSVWTGLDAKVTIPSLRARKLSSTAAADAPANRIVATTAYDFPSALLADAALIDLVLVGDSLAMTMLGHTDTLSVTMDEMLVFTRAVRRGLTRALLVADMPFGSYHISVRDGVRNALRFIKQAGAEAVKLEGGRERTRLICALVAAEIPVLGHLGLTPQSVHRMGGYKVQARSTAEIDLIRRDAHALQDAGCFALVLEGVPREVAAILTAELAIPTIGIGAGPHCDGQILVWHDLLGINVRADGAPPARFVRPYLNAGEQVEQALAHFRRDVQAGLFPSEAESYHLTRGAREELEDTLPEPVHAGA